MQKDPLYNTGKVRIGASFSPPAPMPDAEAERVQRALLGESEPRSPRDDVLAVLCLFASVTALLTFDKWAK